MEGSASTSIIAGPYNPVTDRAVMLQLNGTWEGSARLLRSTDGGTTKHPVTLAGEAWAVFTSNAVEQVWNESEAGAELYIDIALQSGTLAYRVSQ